MEQGESGRTNGSPLFLLALVIEERRFITGLTRPPRLSPLNVRMCTLDKMNMALTAPNPKRFPASLCPTWNMRLNERGLTKKRGGGWAA